MRNKRLLSIMFALVRKCLPIQQIMIILGGSVVQLVRARISDHNVAGSMPVLGIKANYLTDILCAVKD